MTSEEADRIIAEKVMGWFQQEDVNGVLCWFEPGTQATFGFPVLQYTVSTLGLPCGMWDPSFDYNRLHEAEMRLTEEQLDAYSDRLGYTMRATLHYWYNDDWSLSTLRLVGRCFRTAPAADCAKCMAEIFEEKKA